MIYKTEPHLHVREVSPCSKLSAEEMVKLYLEAGYRTIFVSDHLKKKYHEGFEGASWEERTAKFLSGYYLCREAGERLGINVLPSAELMLTESPNHYLLYGISEDFLNKRHDLFDMSISEFYKFAKENGVTVVQAHPYRDGNTVPVDASCIDAIEAVNSNPRHQNFTDLAIAYAKEHGLPMTGGSDAHRCEDVARGGVASECEIKTAEDYVSLLMNNKLEIICEG